MNVVSLPAAEPRTDGRRRKVAIGTFDGVHLGHREVIRSDAKHAARALQGLTIGVSHPALYGDEPMDPGDVASLFLDGLRVRGEHTARGVSC